MITFLLIIKVNIKNIILKKLLYIYYLILFKKINIYQALIKLNNKINTIKLVYILNLGFKIYYINIKAQNIDNFIFKIFKIVLTSFRIKNNLKIS